MKDINPKTNLQLPLDTQKKKTRKWQIYIPLLSATSTLGLKPFLKSIVRYVMFDIQTHEECLVVPQADLLECGCSARYFPVWSWPACQRCLADRQISSQPPTRVCPATQASSAVHAIVQSSEGNAWTSSELSSNRSSVCSSFLPQQHRPLP